MSRLDDLGINTHFIRRLNMREQLVRAADVYPFTVTMHNLAAGHFAARLGLDEGLLLPRPLVEFHLKSKTLQNPVISESHILTLGWASKDEIEEICEVSQRVNDFLCGQFLALGIRMANCTLEFGRVYLTETLDESHIILVDEISPETCHLVDITSGMRLDRSCHEKENSNPSEIYQEVAKRLGILSAGGPPDLKETILLAHSD
jgi:phosphoribosylaminoimidazole-succinocarboxamide synthase